MIKITIRQYKRILSIYFKNLNRCLFILMSFPVIWALIYNCNFWQCNFSSTWGKLSYDMSLALIASYIFYLFTIEFPYLNNRIKLNLLIAKVSDEIDNAIHFIVQGIDPFSQKELLDVIKNTRKDKLEEQIELAIKFKIDSNLSINLLELHNNLKDQYQSLIGEIDFFKFYLHEFPNDILVSFTNLVMMKTFTGSAVWIGINAIEGNYDDPELSTETISKEIACLLKNLETAKTAFDNEFNKFENSNNHNFKK